MENEIEYVSGMGKKSKVPPEIKKWSWGAFLLNWIWGIGNSTYIALLMFVPLVNIVMIFVLGAKGNEWAWKNRTWRNIEHFRSVQKKWAISGLLFWAIFIPVMISTITGVMRNSDAYQLSFKAIQNNTEIIELLGTPLSAGFFITGSVQTSGPEGRAALQYSIKGPKGKGEAYVYANKSMGKWALHQLAVEISKSNKTIEIVKATE